MRVCPRKIHYFRNPPRSLFAMIPYSTTEYWCMKWYANKWVGGSEWSKNLVDTWLADPDRSGWLRCEKPQEIPHATLP